MIENNKNIIDFLHFSTPTKEQVEVLKAMEKFVDEENNDDFLILCGSAGTGKTSITSALVGYLNHKEKSYHIAAPTGRAARIIGRKAKTISSTVHSLIYICEPNKDTLKVTCKLKSDFYSSPKIFIIDEASMLNKEASIDQTLFDIKNGLIFDLIHYVKSSNVNNKLIFLGDRYQLPPIYEEESYALNQTFLENTFNLKGSSFLLTEVKRQEDGSYILQNANDLKNAIDKGETSHPISGIDNSSIYSAASKYYNDLKNNGFDNQIAIAVSNKANKFFNGLIRDKAFGKAKNVLEKGDLLMVVQNWSRNGDNLYNGDHVEVLSIDWNLQEQVAGLHFIAVKLKLISTDTEKIIEDLAFLETIINPYGKIDPKLENNLRRERYIKNKVFSESGLPSDDRYVGALRLIYSYSITCNKAQGGEWNKVYINTLGIPTLKWQYTAITRAKNDIEKF
jgi:exodeoxyribonuclease V